VFRVVTQDRTLAEGIDALLVDLEPTPRPARAANIIQVVGEPGEPKTLYKGCYRRGSGDDADDLRSTFITVLNQAAVDEAGQFAVHASVLADEDRVIAFPAISGGGKTTLAAAGVAGGFFYVSDEALVLDDEAQVVPYPKPMALSRWSCETLGLKATGEETLFTAADLGGSTRTGPGSLTDLVIPAYGSGSPALKPVPSSQAVVELIDKSFNHYKDPERAFRLATHVAQQVGVWKLDYDDPKEAIELVSAVLR